MSWLDKRGPEEKRITAAQNKHYEKHKKEIAAGNAKHERINRRYNERANDARRAGR